MSNQTVEKKNGSVVSIIVMMALFAMIGFVTNLAAPLGLIWKSNYEWSAALGNLMNFVAYLIMGIPAGNILSKYGYKKTALMAIAIGTVGLIVQTLSKSVGAGVELFNDGEKMVELNLFVYLFGAFICGFCVCMLNTVVCPMLNLLGGGGNRGNQLVQIGGTCNSLACTITPFIVGALIGVVAEPTIDSVVPLMLISIGVFILAFVIIYFTKIEEPGRDKERVDTNDGHSAWSFKHFDFGVLAIFFYMGVEVGIPLVLMNYLLPIAGAGVAGGVAAIFFLFMLIGRLLGGSFGSMISSRAQLTGTAGLGLVLVLGALLVPEDVTIPFLDNDFNQIEIPLCAALLAFCGLSASIMWGSIFNLATEGLGKYTEKASGIFMTMVVGGGILPWFQESILADAVGSLASYWMSVVLFAYILWFALVGSKNVNKDIKVD